MYISFDPVTGFDMCVISAREVPLVLALIAAAVILELFLALNWEGRLGWTLPEALLIYTLFKFVGMAYALPNAHEPYTLMKFLPLVLLMENVPTLLLVVVCLLCKRWLKRRSLRRARQLRKSRIEDL